MMAELAHPVMTRVGSDADADMNGGIGGGGAHSGAKNGQCKDGCDKRFHV